jgi:hypothetical protein
MPQLQPKDTTQDLVQPVAVEPRPAAGPMPGEAWVLAIRPPEHSNRRPLPFAAIVEERGIDSIGVRFARGRRTQIALEEDLGRVFLDALDPDFTYRLTTPMPFQYEVDEPTFEKRVHAGAEAIEDSLTQLGWAESELEEGEPTPMTLARQVLGAAERV